MIDWIKDHPYLSGGLILGLIVFYFVYRSVSGSNAAAAQVTGSTGPSDALQAASLQAQVQQQQVQAAADAQSGQTAAALQAAALAAQVTNNQTAAAQAVGLQNILTAGATTQYQAAAQLQAQQASISGQVNIADIAGATQAHIADVTAGAGVQVASINANAGVSIASIQGAVVNNQTAAALAATQNTNATSLGIANLNYGVQALQTNNALTALENTNATNVTVNAQNVGGAVTINQQNNATQQLGINTQGAVAALAINVAQTQANTQAMVDQTTLAQLQAGVYNKGGSGGANQVSVLGGVVGQPSLGNPAQAVQAQGTSSPASIISSIGNLITGGLLGGAKLAAAV